MAVEEEVREEVSTRQIASGDTVPADAETVRQKIALRAYYKYCERGCVPGCDVDDWLAAEREILMAHAKPSAAVAPASADDRRRRHGSRSRR